MVEYSKSTLLFKGECQYSGYITVTKNPVKPKYKLTDAAILATNFYKANKSPDAKKVFNRTKKTLLANGEWYHTTKSGTQHILNSRSAGKPRLEPINGQLISHGSKTRELRAAYFKRIKEQIAQPLINLLLEDKNALAAIYEALEQNLRFGLSISIYRVDTVLPDNDANWVLLKAFNDCLVDSNILPDDNYQFKAWDYIETIPHNENKLILKLWKVNT